MLIGLSQDYLNQSVTSKYVKRYAKILEHNSIDYIWLNAKESDFWDKLAKIDYFIFRFPHHSNEKQIARDVLPIIENEYNIKCYPNQRTCWHYDDKVKQYLLCKAHGFPIVDSWVFYDKTEAIKWAQSATYPVVFKLRGGAGSQNVIMVKSKHTAKKLIKKQFGKGVQYFNFFNFLSTRWNDKRIISEFGKMGLSVIRALQGKDANLMWGIDRNYVLFQKFLPNNNFDTRVIVVGDRVFARQRQNRKNDWRASGIGTQMGLKAFNYNSEDINKEALKIALNVSEKMGFQSMAYDFLIDEDGSPKFCEISYTYGDGMFYAFPGHWDRNLKWHEGHYWPQYLQLVDLLNLPDLKQPNLDKPE